MSAASLFADPHQIGKAVSALAEAIDRDHPNEPPVLIGVLRGCVPFLADLAREMKSDPVIDFLAVSRFGGQAKRGGVVRIIKDIDEEIRGKPIVIVEDIIDTGLTPGYLKRLLSAREPSSIRICGLLDRKGSRVGGLEVDYSGFEAPEGFLLGYGLDLDERMRNLKGLYVVDDLEAMREPSEQLRLRDLDSKLPSRRRPL